MQNSKNIITPPRILIVDDRSNERLTLSKLLSKFNVDVHTAESGQKALSLLLRNSYALVLLDIQMPIMDGIETARLMRNNRHTENIPIIFLTAYDKDEINMMQGYKLGAIDYLFKPVNEEILSLKVETFLRSHSFEKEKEYEKILSELENKNRKLKGAKKKALKMMATAQMTQKRIEEQADELKRYNKELEQFAYVATHDLRAPIINLNGLLDIFKKRGFRTKANESVMMRIESSVNRINNTLDDLIKVVVYRKSVSDESKELFLEEIFTEVMEDFRTQVKEFDGSVISNFEKVPKINYIPGHLRSILHNLISNALKYHALNRRPRISVTSNIENDYISLKVKDNGQGLHEAQMNKAFGLFQRLSTTSNGKGMGLYITKSLVESLGGSITYTSEINKGAEFKVLLRDLAIDK